MDNNEEKDNITMPRISSRSLQPMSGGNHDEILDLLKANLEISQELLKISKKFQKFLAFQKVWVVVKILIIAVPLILGAIYLPPLFQGVISQYQSLFNQYSN